jgi:hypothetical protein
MQWGRIPVGGEIPDSARWPNGRWIRPRLYVQAVTNLDCTPHDVRLRGHA